VGPRGGHGTTQQTQTQPNPPKPQTHNSPPSPLHPLPISPPPSKHHPPQQRQPTQKTPYAIPRRPCRRGRGRASERSQPSTPTKSQPHYFPPLAPLHKTPALHSPQQTANPPHNPTPSNFQTLNQIPPPHPTIYTTPHTTTTTLHTQSHPPHPSILKNPQTLQLVITTTP